MIFKRQRNFRSPLLQFCVDFRFEQFKFSVKKTGIMLNGKKIAGSQMKPNSMPLSDSAVCSAFGT